MNEAAYRNFATAREMFGFTVLPLLCCPAGASIERLEGDIAGNLTVFITCEHGTYRGGGSERTYADAVEAAVVATETAHA